MFLLCFIFLFVWLRLALPSSGLIYLLASLILTINFIRIQPHCIIVSKHSSILTATFECFNISHLYGIAIGNKSCVVSTHTDYNGKLNVEIAQLRSKWRKCELPIRNDHFVVFKCNKLYNIKKLSNQWLGSMDPKLKRANNITKCGGDSLNRFILSLFHPSVHPFIVPFCFHNVNYKPN